jgi:hypothetical protein
MTKFEDHLWREVVTAHGKDLAAIGSAATRGSRRARPGLIAGISLGLAGAGAATGIVLSATPATPAYAVTLNHDGTVTVTVSGRSGIAGANAELRQLGIRASVMAHTPSGCGAIHRQAAPSQGTQDASWTISPRKVPPGRTLVLTMAAKPHGSGGPGGKIWSCPAQGALRRQSAPPAG